MRPQALYLDDNFHFMFTDNPRFEAVECEALYTFAMEFCGEVHRYVVLTLIKELIQRAGLATTLGVSWATSLLLNVGSLI